MPALIVPGFDPTALTAIVNDYGTAQEISAADLYALVANVTPAARVGWWWVSDTQPDVLATPSLARFVWYAPTARTQKVYNGVAWELIGHASQSIDGGAITDGTLDIAAFAIPGGSALKIIQVNAGGTAFQFTTIVDAIAAGTVPVTKLIPGAEAHVLSVVGGIATWKPIDLQYLLNAIAVGQLPVDRLAPGTNGYVLKTLTGVVQWAAETSGGGVAVTAPDAGKWLTNNGTITQWASLPAPAAVTAAGIAPGTNGQILGTVGGVVAWTTVDVIGGWAHSALLAPTNGQTFTHGLGARPRRIEAFLVCKTSYGSFVANETTIPITSVIYSTPGGLPQGYQVFALSADATNVKLHFYDQLINFNAALNGVTAMGLIGSISIPITTRWDIQIIAKL